MHARDPFRYLPIVVLAALTPEAHASAAFSLVVNTHNSIPSLSTSEVKRLISGGTKVWGNGAVVQIGIIPGDAPETQFVASIAQTTSRELLSLIQQQVFKGELRRPVVLRSSADCLALAASNSGALCIAAVGASVPDGARIVPVQ